MKEKNTMAHGEVQESLSFRIDYNICEVNQSLRTEKNVTKTVSFEWGSFSCGSGMSIKEMLDFQKHANELLQEVKSLLGNGVFVKVELIKSAYENVPEYTINDELGPHTSTLKTLEFERWFFEDSTLDCDPEEDGAGLYLRPDTRYTNESWDMELPWKQDILKSLAEAHL